MARRGPVPKISEEAERVLEAGVVDALEVLAKAGARIPTTRQIIAFLEKRSSPRVKEVLARAPSVLKRETIERKVRRWRGLAPGAGPDGRLRGDDSATSWRKMSVQRKEQVAQLILSRTRVMTAGPGIRLPNDPSYVAKILDRAVSGQSIPGGLPRAEQEDMVIRSARDLGIISPTLASAALRDLALELDKPVWKRKVDPAYCRAV